MEQVEDTDKRLSFLPLEKATNPPEGIIEHIKDRWWIVHPIKGLVFFRKFAPQCNSNEELTKSLAVMYPWSKVQFIPSVFRRINPRDY